MSMWHFSDRATAIVYDMVYLHARDGLETLHAVAAARRRNRVVRFWQLSSLGTRGRPLNGVAYSLCSLHIARGRGGRVWALVQLTLCAEPVVQVRGVGPLPRAARPAAAPARTLQSRPKL